MTDFTPADQEALYEKLTAEIPGVKKNNQGHWYAPTDEYITRLNEVFGFANWNFEAISVALNVEADEFYAKTRITYIRPDGIQIYREQYGSQKIIRYARGEKEGQIIDIGNNIKGAVSDAMKKTATLFGVGLYLSHQESDEDSGSATSATTQQRAVQKQASSSDDEEESEYTCEECGEHLTKTTFRDGSSWDAEKLKSFGQNKFQKTLCMTHYREANDAKKASENVAPKKASTAAPKKAKATGDMPF